MTTAVTIDAHAGWDVKVTVATLDNKGQILSSVDKVIPKHTKETVYIYSHMKLTEVSEIKPT